MNKLYISQNMHTFSLYSSLYGKINDIISTRDVSNIARKLDNKNHFYAMFVAISVTVTHHTTAKLIRGWLFNM